MLDVAKQAVEAARAAGADYADGRVVADDTESLTVRNQEMEGIDRSSSVGLGIRVLVNGYWGFAATARQEPEEVERTAKLDRWIYEDACARRLALCARFWVYSPAGRARAHDLACSRA